MRFLKIGGALLLVIFLFTGFWRDVDRFEESRHPAGLTAADPDYHFLSALKESIHGRRTDPLKRAVNSLLSPPEYRPPGIPKAKTVEEIEALADRMGIERSDVGFQEFLDLYREAPTIAPGVRRYQN
jgi:hypothetical protein